MLSSAYYRRQADICLGMALAAKDEETAEEFRALALAFLSKATGAEEGAASAMPEQDLAPETELRRD